MSAKDEIKNKILEKEEKAKQERNARRVLMGGNPPADPSKDPTPPIDPPTDQSNESEDIEDEIKDEEIEEKEEMNNPQNEIDDEFTIRINPLVLKMRDPEQTLGLVRANLTELMGCHFEPEVAKVFKADKKKKPRGFQSHLVNELVKQYYKEKGKL